MKTETWEEVTYFDRDGRLLRGSSDCGHKITRSESEASDATDTTSGSSRVISARTSARSVARKATSNRLEQRSRSQGGESSTHTMGSIEFGGGTVRPEQKPKSSEVSSASRSASSTTTVTESGFARSRIPMTVEKSEKEEQVMSSSVHETTTSSVKSTR